MQALILQSEKRIISLEKKTKNKRDNIIDEFAICQTGFANFHLHSTYIVFSYIVQILLHRVESSIIQQLSLYHRSPCHLSRVNTSYERCNNHS